MAHVEKRGKNRYRARYRDPNNKERSMTFARKMDAERFLTSVDHSKLSGTYVDPAAGKITFRTYAEAWRKRKTHRPTTAAQVETNLRRHVYPMLGDLPIGSIRQSDIQSWVKNRAELLASGTVEVIYRYVVAIFRDAAENRVVAATPTVGISLPEGDGRRVVPPTPDQVDTLIGSIPERYRALLIAAAGTGLRQGELFGLTVDRVDFLRKRLTVDRQLILLPGGGPAFGPPKTKASNRVVPLGDVVIAALSQHLAEYPVVDDPGFIFTNDRRQPIRRTRFSDVWRPAARAAEVPLGDGMHILRHYYASLLIRHGSSVIVVQTNLGHSSATETLDRYGHLWHDDQDRSREAVDVALGGRLWLPAEAVGAR